MVEMLKLMSTKGLLGKINLSLCSVEFNLLPTHKISDYQEETESKKI